MTSPVVEQLVVGRGTEEEAQEDTVSSSSPFTRADTRLVRTNWLSPQTKYHSVTTIS